MGISVQNLTKVYGTQKAIDDISFEIPTGQIVGFLGPNGAGKTTTMKIITCFMPPTSGTVELDEFNIFDHSLQIRRKIGYLPEHNPLYLDMYVREYLRFTARLYQMPANQIKSRVDEMIKMTGLELEQNKKIKMLSKGYRQRVGLAQALIHDPEVLILDEPTSGLDPNQIIEIRNLIREIGKTKTVIFSTHILSEVEAIADRVIILDRGKIIADEDTQNLQFGSKEEIVLNVVPERPDFDFKEILAMEGVEDLVESRQGGGFSIRIQKSADIRAINRKLLENALAQDNLITGIRQSKSNLEDVFRVLTKSAGSGGDSSRKRGGNSNTSKDKTTAQGGKKSKSSKKTRRGDRPT